MTVKNIIDQIEQIFGRQPEKLMLQLVNDALIEISGEARHYKEVDSKMIDIVKVEIKDTNDRYVKIPKLVDPHKLLRGDTDEAESSLT
jgi:hypothetical protein